MLNNFYFNKDEEPIKISFGDSEFKESCIKYLAKEFNYTFKDLMNETGLSDRDLEALYEQGMTTEDFVNILMEEVGFNRRNYFNIILSGGRNITP